MTETLTLGKSKKAMTERVVILMNKEEKEKLNDACYALGKQLKAKVSMGELIRYAVFNVYLPEALKKIKS